MRVYDCDGTIYRGDSTYDFYLYLLGKYPKILLHLPRFLYSYILYKLNIPIAKKEKFKYLNEADFKVLNKTFLKQTFFSFLNEINKKEIDRIIDTYWNRQINNKKIFKYYLKQRRKDDVIISASPRFLLEPIVSKFGCTLICSEVDKYTGKYNSLSCWWKEKVSRFKEVYDDAVIDEFYSDSIVDLPLALIAKKSYKVLKDGKVINWNF